MIVNRKIIGLIFCGLLAFNLATAQKEISGSYLAYTADTSNILILKLQKDSAGYNCRYDLPLAKIMNANARNVKWKGDTLTVYLQQPVASFSTVANSNGQLIDAVWKQNGQTLPHLIKPLLRPQSPKPPYPYLTDSVEYDNTEGSVHLGATLTRPKGNQKFGAVILITGSGLEDRDETIFEHQPFAVLANYLTRQGIAVLRVDDRQRGKSKGDVLKATSVDFAEDVLTSLAWLKKQPNIDSTKIGLIGHSEGGMLAAMAYNQWPHFAYIVSLGGTGVSGSAVMLPQSTNALKGKVSPAAYTALYQLAKQGYATIDRYYDKDSMAIAATTTDFDAWKAAQPDSILNELNLKAATGAQYALQTKMSLANPWLKYFLHTDPSPFWQKVKCPVLALNGEKDRQVDAVQNTSAIKNALQKGGNTKVSVQILPRLNHLFQHCNTGDFTEYALIEETFSAGALSAIGNWIKSLK